MTASRLSAQVTGRAHFWHPTGSICRIVKGRRHACRYSPRPEIRSDQQDRGAARLVRGSRHWLSGQGFQGEVLIWGESCPVVEPAGTGLVAAGPAGPGIGRGRAHPWRTRSLLAQQAPLRPLRLPLALRMCSDTWRSCSTTLGASSCGQRRGDGARENQRRAEYDQHPRAENKRIQ